MARFKGDKEFTQAPDMLFEKLADARFLVQCIPDVQKVTRSEREIAVCTIRPGVTFVRGTLDLTIRITGTMPPISINLLLNTKGIGSTSVVEATLTLSDAAAGTHLHWSAEIKELGGLLKAIPQGLIQASAQKVIADSWQAIEAKLQS